MPSAKNSNFYFRNF